jgi:single-stranded DNA-binding protein
MTVGRIVNPSELVSSIISSFIIPDGRINNPSYTNNSGRNSSMSQATLQQVLEQIQALNPDELQEVNRAIQERLESDEDKRQRFHQALHASGLVKQFKTPPADDIPDRKLVSVQGEPVSQTIIEERR